MARETDLMNLMNRIESLEERVRFLSKLESGGRWIYLTTPLTSTSWNGAYFSTTSKTLIDLSAAFDVPAGAKAIDVKVATQDPGSAGALCYLVLGPTNTTGMGKTFTCSEINGRYMWHSAIVPCDANGDVYYQTVASGAGKLRIWVEIWGYWI